MRNFTTHWMLAVSILGLLAAGSRSAPVPEFDSDAAEQRLRTLYPFQNSLHEAQRGPDGVRGFGLAAPNASVAADPNPLPPPFTTSLAWNAYWKYCGWDAIVRATFLSSTPVLGGDKNFIYTVSRFSIVDSIKGDVPFKPGQRLVVYRVGGAVEDDGEKLRIDTPDSAAFEPQKDYILILKRDKKALAQQYFAPSGQTIAVTNEKVNPIPGKYAWLRGLEAFPTGSTYTALRDTFMKVHTMKSCSDGR